MTKSEKETYRIRKQIMGKVSKQQMIVEFEKFEIADQRDKEEALKVEENQKAYENRSMIM
jgi:hypothetical protein